MNNIYHNGLDKTILTGFQVKSIDFEKLLSQRDSVTIIYQSNQNVYCNVPDEVTGENKSFSNISIQDNCVFSDLKIGVSIVNGQLIFYESLSLYNTSNGENNLIPMSLEFYIRKLNETVAYIYTRYGIKLDISHIRFKELEYNATIKINGKFEDYERLLMLFCKTRRGTLKYGDKPDVEKDFTGYYVHNKSIQYKFYDKTKQLNEKFNIEITAQWLRIELSILNGSQNSKATLEKYLGTSEVFQIDSNSLKQMLLTMFNRDFIKPFQKYLHQSEKITLEVLKDAKKEHKKNYLFYAISDLKTKEIDEFVPPCFSYGVFTDAFNKLEKGNSNRAKALKASEEHIPKKWIGEDARLNVILDVLDRMVDSIATATVAIAN